MITTMPTKARTPIPSTFQEYEPAPDEWSDPSCVAFALNVPVEEVVLGCDADAPDPESVPVAAVWELVVALELVPVEDLDMPVVCLEVVAEVALNGKPKGLFAGSAGSPGLAPAAGSSGGLGLLLSSPSPSPSPSPSIIPNGSKSLLLEGCVD